MYDKNIIQDCKFFEDDTSYKYKNKIIEIVDEIQKKNVEYN